ncbi:MAG: hypothetical protein K2J73_00655 [Oscillospiraceae bacterium]|nr:hypothetical protein [Oscillospiraceae bacterium]
MKKARTVTVVLCIAAAAVISLCVNFAGGFALAFMVESSSHVFHKCGIALLASSAFLIAGTVVACFKKVWIPLIFNIIGTACYIYTVSEIYAIPNTMRPKTDTEPLAERHLFTVIVTLLLFMLTVFNYLDEKNAAKRNEKRRLKAEKLDKKLSDDEKII